MLASYYHWQNELTFVDIFIMKSTLVPTQKFKIVSWTADTHIENEHRFNIFIISSVS